MGCGRGDGAQGEDEKEQAGKGFHGESAGFQKSQVTSRHFSDPISYNQGPATRNPPFIEPGKRKWVSADEAGATLVF